MSVLTDAAALVGGLSKPSKMPGPAYGTSAKQCQTGGKLRAVKGSTCENCYALKGMYRMPNVADAHARSMASVVAALADEDARVKWVAAMVTLLRDVPYFRWHDSGDLMSRAHFDLIADVARATPNTRHWLPTREARYIGTAPENLVVRLSAPMVDAGPVPGYAHTSTVHKFGAPHGRECPAPKQGNACGDCRACWDSSVANVSYHAH